MQYSTSFLLTESPISESGNWLTGLNEGSDWHGVQTTSGKAFTMQSGSDTSGFDDAIAIVKGTFGADQEAYGTVFNSASSGSVAEIALHLRTTITTGSITGYECYISASPDYAYCSVARWNGSFNGGQYWTSLGTANPGHINNGDVFKATIVGSTINVYVNSTLVLTVTDSTYTTGNPGLGFDLKHVSADAVPNSFGFISFHADDTPGVVASPQAINVTNAPITANSHYPSTAGVAIPSGYTGWKLNLDTTGISGQTVVVAVEYSRPAWTDKLGVNHSAGEWLQDTICTASTGTVLTIESSIGAVDGGGKMVESYPTMVRVRFDQAGTWTLPSIVLVVH